MISGQGPTHRKVVIDDAPWKPFFFADHYRFGDHVSPSALVYYIGGAGDSQRYADRVATEPEVLRDIFADAVQRSKSMATIDLLVSPAPLTTPEQREDRLSIFQQFFQNVLMARITGHLSQRIAFVGSAYGSFFATHLAFSLKESRALALLSGMGMIEAFDCSGAAASEQLPDVCCFANDNDEIARWTLEFAVHMKRSVGKPPVLVRRPGERTFDDYRSNGSLTDAFDFVLKKLVQ